jgi:hypothetical protein
VSESTDIRGTARGGLMAAVLLVVVLAVLVGASAATAAPKGIFSIFSDCPLKTPGVALCQYAQTTSGEFVLGTTRVPINKTITLQGGAVPTGNPENEREYFLVPAADGNSLSKTELNVPGGLLDFVNCEEIKGKGILELLERGTCKAIFENHTTGVTATAELVAGPHNPPVLDLVALATEEGTALTLPVRVHLKNSLLGNKCYVGSEASPIELRLTTGATSPAPPNKSINGARGHVSNTEEHGQVLLQIKENSLVDNAFSAPVAEGCGELFSFLIDPIVNAKVGLPSPGGHNTAILNGSLNTATTEAVIASEGF